MRFLVNKPQHEIDPNYWSSVNIRGAITTITIRTILVTFGLRVVSAIQHIVVGRKGCYLLWCALSFPRQKIIWEARAGPRLIDISAYGDKKILFWDTWMKFAVAMFWIMLSSSSSPPPAAMCFWRMRHNRVWIDLPPAAGKRIKVSCQRSNSGSCQF